jgi:hypothetical protein
MKQRISPPIPLLATLAGLLVVGDPARAAIDMVPDISLPVQYSGVETFWDGHPLNPVNREGYNASTNPLPPVAVNTPGRDADGNTVNPRVPGAVVTLASGGDIKAAITGADTPIAGDPLNRTGNVTVVLAAGGTYNGFDLKGFHNIAIICPTAQYNPGADGIPGTGD